MSLLRTHLGSRLRSQDIVDVFFPWEQGLPNASNAFDATRTEVVSIQKAAKTNIVLVSEMLRTADDARVDNRPTSHSGDGPRNLPAAHQTMPTLHQRPALAQGRSRY